jgi:hypothetical protein
MPLFERWSTDGMSKPSGVSLIRSARRMMSEYQEIGTGRWRNPHRVHNQYSHFDHRRGIAFSCPTRSATAPPPQISSLAIRSVPLSCSATSTTRRRLPLLRSSTATGSEIGTTGFDRPDKGDAQRLWNLAPRIAEQRFSRIYRGRKELIDHIFVSHGLVGRTAQDHVTTDAAGPTPSIDDDPTQRRGAPGSDHRPVLASIDL